MDYWEECISEALDDAGLSATKEQIDTIASWVEGAHENYGMAHGYNVTPNPSTIEIERLKADLSRERDKVTCSACGGSGRIISFGPYHGSNTGCWKCGGEGRL